MTKCVGIHEMSREEVKADKAKCVKFGPCGLGRKAMYLNSFYIDRKYYVMYEDIDRIYKIVAMSKGGFTGKGIFGSMAYLAVKLKSGEVRKCNFKYEFNVDMLMDEFHKAHPNVPLHSEEAEKKLRKAEEEEQRKYLKKIPAKVQKEIDYLEECKEELQVRPAVYEALASKAKQKRTIERINPTYRRLAIVIMLLAIALAVVGVYGAVKGAGDRSIYMVLFAIAIIFSIMATRVIPTGKYNKQQAEEEWQEALAASQRNIAGYDNFPVPAQYAHPVVIDRMIRILKQGRAETAKDAYVVMKNELKKMNNTVTVSQKEYDEIVLIKPMFLVMDYQ